MKVTVVDPSAYTPPYDHALCQALAQAGLDVELATSRFLYGPVPTSEDYKTRECFYRRSTSRYRSRPQARVRYLSKLAEHPIDMLRFVKELAGDGPDVAHFQWLTVQPLDLYFLRRIEQPVVLTAHDVLPREPRLGQLVATRKICQNVGAVVVHSEHGRERLIGELRVEPAKVHVIPHGAFDYLTRLPRETSLDKELEAWIGERPLVLFFGLIRPYKGIDVLIEAFSETQDDALLLVVGMPRMPLGPLRLRVDELRLGERVKFVPRFVTDPEIPAYFRRADLVVLPYREIDQSGVLYTALAFHKPMILSSVGGFTEFADQHAAARLVQPGDPDELAGAIGALLRDSSARAELSARAAAAARGPFSWNKIAERTIQLYRSLL